MTCAHIQVLSYTQQIDYTNTSTHGISIQSLFISLSYLMWACPAGPQLFTDKFEVNITDLIPERLGKSIYTTILARYASFPERLLQCYVNGRPVRPANTIFDVKHDGLNTYL